MWIFECEKENKEGLEAIKCTLKAACFSAACVHAHMLLYLDVPRWAREGRMVKESGSETMEQGERIQTSIVLGLHSSPLTIVRGQHRQSPG